MGVTIVSEIIARVTIIMIVLEKHNNYMFSVACSNKKSIDSEKLEKKKETGQI